MKDYLALYNRHILRQLFGDCKKSRQVVDAYPSCATIVVDGFRQLNENRVPYVSDMAEQRKDIVPPKIPPPPPPRPKTQNSPAGTSLLGSTSPPSNPGASTNKASPTSPPVRMPKIQRPVPPPPDLSEAAKLLSSTSPPKPVVQPFGPRLPPVCMNPAGRDPPTPQSARSAAEATPKKTFFQSVCSRTRDFFSRNKTTTYEPLPKQQSAAVASPPSTPQKKGGFFKNLFETKSATTTTPVRLDDTSSDTESSPDRMSSYSGDHETGSPQDVRFADTSSDISASDLEEADVLRPQATSCKIVEHRDDPLVSVRVNSPADIRVTKTVTGDVTTCVRTAAEYKGNMIPI